MIRRRWRLLLVLTLLLLAGALALVPGVRWPVYGWLRGEASYQGWPTSYWANELRRWEEDDVGSATIWTRWPSNSERAWSWLVGSPPPSTLFSAFWEAMVDPDAVPVLMELFQLTDDHVRSLAAYYLGRIGRIGRIDSPEHCAFELLLEAWRQRQAAPEDERSDRFRRIVERALRDINYDAAARAGVKQPE